MPKQYGFKKPVIDNTHWKLGSSVMPFITVVEDGNWLPYLSAKEMQCKKFETYNCTSFNTLSQIETYMKKVFGIDVDYSDRWLGKVSGTDPKIGGNDPHVVYEAIRKYGLIPDSMLPYSDDLNSVEEYYSFKGGNEEECRAEGKRWLEKYSFFHEWVNTECTPEEARHNMKVALKSSPLAREVYAWYQDERGIFIKMSTPNHWTCEYNIENFDKIFDSYDPFLKDVEQETIYCKRIYITQNAPKQHLPASKSLWSRIITFLSNLFVKRNIKS